MWGIVINLKGMVTKMEMISVLGTEYTQVLEEINSRNIPIITSGYSAYKLLQVRGHLTERELKEFHKGMYTPRIHIPITYKGPLLVLRKYLEESGHATGRLPHVRAIHGFRIYPNTQDIYVVAGSVEYTCDRAAIVSTYLGDIKVVSYSYKSEFRDGAFYKKEV